MTQQILLIGLNVCWQITALALVALGLAIVFGLLRILNMAHGEFFMLGAYSHILTSELNLPSVLTFPICFVLVGSTALLVERLVVRHLYDRIFDSLLATWGISILIREIVEMIWGRSFRNVPPPLDGVVTFAGLDYPAFRLLVMLATVVFALILYRWYKKSMTAVNIRAMVANPRLAESSGINTSRLATIGFVAGCICAGLAGLILSPTIGIEPNMGLDALIRSFFALVVGGLGTLEGLGVGVAIVGGIQAGLSATFDQTTGYLGVLVLSILFLWKRPDGLYQRN